MPEAPWASQAAAYASRRLLLVAALVVLIGGLLVTAARFNRLSDDMNRGFVQVSRSFTQIEARFAQMDERFARADGILLDRADRLAGLDAVQNAQHATLEACARVVSAVAHSAGDRRHTALPVSTADQQRR